MSYMVARRTKELGIRMALGASRWGMQWLVLRESLLMVGTGILAGIPAAFALTGLLKAVLYGVMPADPVSFFAAAFVMIGVAAAAAWIPPRRAALVDPIISLRCE
jgi:ABC-type antimicrobial peptide transport system permease subunit